MTEKILSKIFLILFDRRVDIFATLFNELTNSEFKITINALLLLPEIHLNTMPFFRDCFLKLNCSKIRVLISCCINHHHNNYTTNINDMWLYASLRDNPITFGKLIILAEFMLNYPEYFDPYEVPPWMEPLQYELSPLQKLCLKKLNDRKFQTCQKIKETLDSILFPICAYWDSNICSIIDTYIPFEIP